MTSRISAREVLLECTKRAGRKRNRQPLVACRRIDCALSRGLFVIAIAAGTAYVHAMFVALTVCDADSIKPDGHVKQESRRATPESAKQIWRRNRAKTRWKSPPTMDLHRRTSEGPGELVWSEGCTWILPPGAVVPNPKSETRNPKQIQMPNGPRPRTASRVVVWVIPCLVLGVCFGLRVSDFGFPRSGWR